MQKHVRRLFLERFKNEMCINASLLKRELEISYPTALKIIRDLSDKGIIKPKFFIDLPGKYYKIKNIKNV